LAVAKSPGRKEVSGLGRRAKTWPRLTLIEETSPAFFFEGAFFAGAPEAFFRAGLAVPADLPAHVLRGVAFFALFRAAIRQNRVAESRGGDVEGQTVLELLSWLRSAGVDAWVDGGWGVDALLRRQTRPHADLDLVVPMPRVPALRSELEARGFAARLDELPVRFVMTHPELGSIDFHPVEFDAEGGGVQAQPGGGRFRYPPEGFVAAGSISGQRVSCLSPEVQLLCHLGYPPAAKDIHDVLLLHAEHGVVLPPAYGRLAPAPSGAPAWRFAGPLDLPLLARLNAQLILDEGHPNPMGRRALEERMRGWLASSYRAVLFFDGDSVAAYALFQPLDACRGAARVHLRHFFVVRASRRRGTGRAAIACLRSEIWPRDAEVTLEVLVDNEPARAFWVAVGFAAYAIGFEAGPLSAPATRSDRP
jgi:lincosamide nucleotidyltransferase A/C/D/E